MTTMQKILGAILLLLVAFASGLFVGRGQKQVEIREVRVKGDTVEKIVERIVEKVRTVKPDGTVEEKEVTRDITRDKKDTIISEGKERKETPLLPKWSVGGGVMGSYIDEVKVQYYGSMGHRLMGPIWVEAQAGMQHAAVGIRVEF